MAEWISVEDGLPEVGESVDVAIQMKGLLIDRDGAWLILESGGVMRQITHWRVPEPPKRSQADTLNGMTTQQLCQLITEICNKIDKCPCIGIDDVETIVDERIADAFERAIRDI